MKNSIAACLFMAAVSLGATAAAADALPQESVYQGAIRLPDFAGRDRAYADYRTRITNAMRAGPNFAGHYAIVEIGCGTSCRFAFLGDVATGQVFSFPYGGEDYYSLHLDYHVNSRTIAMSWVDGDECLRNSLEWNGRQFLAGNPAVAGPAEACE
ncbi:hypothetical protein [Kerstersia sp.]|uniref:hypothetical protein n=1 Tax=Kerstersia sp. TaxID=1930783 RepID=UPI003F9032E5